MTDQTPDAGQAATGEDDAAAMFAEITAAEKDKADGKSPAEVPAAETPASEAQPAAAAAPTQTETPDFKAAYEAATASIAQLERENRGFRNRVPKLQSELDQLKKKGAAAIAEDAPRGAAPADVPLPGDDGWAKFKEEYPEIAGPLEKRFNQLGDINAKLARVEEVEKKVAQINARADDEAFAREEQALSQRHPDFAVIRDHPEFEKWLSRQPAAVQDLRHSTHFADADYLLTHFKDELRQAQAAAAPVVAAQPPKPALSTRRVNQLESAVTPRGSVPAALRGGVPDEPEAAFNEFARRAS